MQELKYGWENQEGERAEICKMFYVHFERKRFTCFIFALGFTIDWKYLTVDQPFYNKTNTVKCVKYFTKNILQWNEWSIN